MKNKLDEAFENVDPEYVGAEPVKTKKRRVFFSTIAAAVVLAMIIVPLSVVLRQPSPEVPTDLTETERHTVEQFHGEKGNYTGVKYMNVADTSATAKTVYGGKYYENKNIYRSGASKLTGFFDKLTKKLIDGKQSAVVSPVNIYMALALLAECTDGNSRAQILDFIGVRSIEELREQTKLIWLYNSRDDESGRSLLANSVWLSSDLPVKENCADTLKNDHYASSFTGDFADPAYKNALKQWLSDQTEGLLDDCINELFIPDSTAAVLASTLYYKAKWYSEYRETEDGVFRGKNGSVNCTFNKKTQNGVIYEGDGFAAYAEILSDGNYMWFFLPDENRTVSDVLNSDPVSFIRNAKADASYDVTVRMPDFDVDYNRSILDDLKALGIVDCADPDKADFSAFTDDDLYLSEVIHAARFKADKTGVEGAAYTVELLSGGMPVDCKDYNFTLDRPFVFMVVNDGIPLFTGCVNDLG